MNRSGASAPVLPYQEETNASAFANPLDAYGPSGSLVRPVQNVAEQIDNNPGNVQPSGYSLPTCDGPNCHRPNCMGCNSTLNERHVSPPARLTQEDLSFSNSRHAHPELPSFRHLTSMVDRQPAREMSTTSLVQQLQNATNTELQSVILALVTDHRPATEENILQHLAYCQPRQRQDLARRPSAESSRPRTNQPSNFRQEQPAIEETSSAMKDTAASLEGRWHTGNTGRGKQPELISNMQADTDQTNNKWYKYSLSTLHIPPPLMGHPSTSQTG